MKSCTRPTVRVTRHEGRIQKKKSLEVYQHLSLESVDQALPGCGTDRWNLMREWR